MQLYIHTVYLRCVTRPTPALPGPSSSTCSAFAGLQNGGATCYMSSVFQQLFMQPIIRCGLLGCWTACWVLDCLVSRLSAF